MGCSLVEIIDGTWCERDIYISVPTVSAIRHEEINGKCFMMHARVLQSPSATCGGSENAHEATLVQRDKSAL